MNRSNGYYQIFGRLRASGAVEGYVARTTCGDDEFDEVVAKLELEYFDHADDHETAIECLTYHCAKRGWHLQVEVRYMEVGALTSPWGMFRLSAADVKHRLKKVGCLSCAKNVDELESMLVNYSLTDTAFCSFSCVEQWYEQLPFEKQGVLVKCSQQLKKLTP